MQKPFPLFLGPGFLLLSSLSPACGTDPGGPNAGTGSTVSFGDGSGAGTMGPPPASGGAEGADGGIALPSGGTGDGVSGAAGAGSVCETAASSAELSPVYLAFAFDVSGSMGALDRPRWWHDPGVKWEPVARATRSFFEDSGSAGIYASLTLFPSSEEGGRCDPETYGTPDVPMQELPSPDFGSVLSDYEQEVGSPLAGGDWRGGTPTLAAHAGAASSLLAVRSEEGSARLAIVLVTDGLPQSCDDVDVEAVAVAVADLYEAEGIPTYVIGIENPSSPPSALPDGWADWGECDTGPGGGDVPCEVPENLTALDAIADAGGTGSAFLIDTGDPERTRVAFSVAIDSIRESAISCRLEIPPHPQEGATFDKDKIDVRVDVGAGVDRLDYDPECLVARSWRYDDELRPTNIELCPDTCEELQLAETANLEVEFLCEPRPDVVR